MKSAYDAEFYRGHHDAVQSSASRVVPILYELTRPFSVLDVGCGDGSWLSEFRTLARERSTASTDPGQANRLARRRVH
jgi:ubiquinone/menaquinone biosynthesis C-methylase UbiE